MRETRVVPPERVLLAEDDLALAESIEFALAAEGFEIDIVGDGETALERMLKERFDLLLLDLTLPRLSGMEVCRRVRAESTVPIIIISARSSELDRVLGLESGADDYVTKPVSLTELLSHVRAILRRRRLDQAPGTSSVFRVGGLELDLLAHRLYVGGAEIAVTPSEFEILSLLAEHPGRVFTRQEIMRHLWRSGYTGDARACDTHIVNIRRKIEPDPKHPHRLETVRGVGYRLSPV
jgi:two-component system response regulator RegX3